MTPPVRPEPWWTRQARRAASIGAIGIASALAAALAPALLPLLLVIDALSGWSFARAYVLIGWYLVCEVLGVAAAGVLWLRRLVTAPTPADWEAWNYALQGRWASALLRGAEKVFALRIDVRGDASGGPGPVLCLSRHASVADTLLPAVFLTARHGLRLRTVLKRELLWDPCLDIVGQRVPNAFVGRDGQNRAGEIAKVAQIARGLGPHDGVLIYPEGTRFSARKLAEVRAKLDEAVAAGRGDVRLHTLAHTLTHVLPPRLGGVLAALDAAPDADVTFCTHVGFDGIRTFADLVRGTLVGRHVQVEFRRVPRAAIPTDTDGQIAWLLAEWQELDRAVGLALDAGR